MIANWTQLVLLLSVVWPLLLVVALVTPGLRRGALRLVPWAALPALAASVLPVAVQVPLPEILLGSALVLDGTGRVFLLLNAVLWLAGGMLASRQYRITPPPSQSVILLLLAMSGTMGMAITADALLFFACATITGYSVLGLLICQGSGASRRAGGIFVVVLVVSDLVLYELFLHLAHETVGTDFAALRHAMAESHSRGLLLGLLLVGLGIKTGIAGLHFWLAPAFKAAAPAMRPVLVSFILTAGILAWVRLLPLGDVQWTGAGDLLRWLGAITVAYAVIAGARDTGSSVTAYAAMTMNGVLLALLGVALSHPHLWAFSRLSPTNWFQAAWMLPAAAVLAWLLRKPLISALRLIPTVSFGGSSFAGLTKAVQSGLEIIGSSVAHWRDRLFDRIQILFTNILLPGWMGAAETRMTRWRNAFALILMAILVAVAWSW